MNAPPLLPGETIRLIKQLVAARYHIPLEAMSSPKRTREYAHPRQMAMTLAVEFTKLSAGRIGKCFGGRKRWTVVHAMSAVKQRAAKSQMAREDLADFRDRLRNLPILQKST